MRTRHLPWGEIMNRQYNKPVNSTCRISPIALAQIWIHTLAALGLCDFFTYFNFFCDLKIFVDNIIHFYHEHFFWRGSHRF